MFYIKKPTEKELANNLIYLEREELYDFFNLRNDIKNLKVPTVVVSKYSFPQLNLETTLMISLHPNQYKMDFDKIFRLLEFNNKDILLFEKLGEYHYVVLHFSPKDQENYNKLLIFPLPVFRQSPLEFEFGLDYKEYI